MVGIVVAGVLYKEFIGSSGSTLETGVVKEFTIVSKKLEWRFEPASIEINQGDRVKLTIVNEDNFDHGFAINALGIDQRLPANGTITEEFVARKSGVFQFYCSVSCSSSDNSSFNLEDGFVQTGPDAGTVQGHFDHLGEFIVRALEVLGLGEDDPDHVHDDTHAH